MQEQPIGRMIDLKIKLQNYKDQLNVINADMSVNLEATPHCSTSMISTALSPLNLYNDHGDNMDIDAILHEFPKSKQFIINYVPDMPFTVEHRKVVAEAIINHSVMAEGARFDKQFYKKAANAIVKRFPQENQFRHLYYTEGMKTSNGKYQPNSGILLSKRNTIGRLYRPKMILSSDVVDDNIVASNYTDEEMSAAKKWLVFGRQTEENIMENWEKCFVLRQREFKSATNGSELLDQWPILKTAYGKTLVDYDFNEMYPEKGNILFQKWPELHNSFLPYLKANLKYPQLRQLFDKFYCDPSNDSVNKDCLLAFFLPAVIKTNFKIGNWRPSIDEMQEGFVMHAETTSDAELKIENRIKKLELLSTPAKSFKYQPHVIVVGDLINPLSFITYFAGVQYVFPNFVMALDCAVKIIFVFNYTQCFFPKN